MTIEAASAAHAAVLAAIHADCFPPAERWGADAMALQLGLPGAFGFVALSADGAGGGLVLVRVAADEAEILSLAVMPGVRRTGLGRGLMQAAMAAAAARGAVAMLLEVGVANAAAGALYASLGFAAVGRRRGYYGPGRDAVILRAAL